MTPAIGNAASPFAPAALDAEIARFLAKDWSGRNRGAPTLRTSDPIGTYRLSEESLWESDPLRLASRLPMWSVAMEVGGAPRVMLVSDLGGKPRVLAFPEADQTGLQAALRLGRALDPDGEVRWLLAPERNSAVWLPDLDDALIPADLEGVPVTEAEVDPGFLARLAPSAPTP